jgi:hypothetical protein
MVGRQVNVKLGTDISPFPEKWLDLIEIVLQTFGDELVSWVTL